jgi:predicted membrane protein
MQNIYIPLPLGMHIGFCIIATIVYILEIYRKKSRHYFFMMLAVDATLLMQVFPNSTMVVILAIIEALLLGAAGVMAYMEHKKNKLEQQAEAEKTAAEQAQQISDGEANENSDT